MGWPARALSYHSTLVRRLFSVAAVEGWGELRRSWEPPRLPSCSSLLRLGMASGRGMESFLGGVGEVAMRARVGRVTIGACRAWPRWMAQQTAGREQTGNRPRRTARTDRLSRFGPRIWGLASCPSCTRSTERARQGARVADGASEQTPARAVGAGIHSTLVESSREPMSSPGRGSLTSLAP